MSQEAMPHPHSFEPKSSRVMLLVAGVIGVLLVWLLVVDPAMAERPATSPAGVLSGPSDVDAARAENDRLRKALKNAQSVILFQKDEIAALSKRMLELNAVHKEKTPSTNPATPEAGRDVMMAARLGSHNNLVMIGQSLLMYANMHDQKGPATLEQLRLASDIPSATFQPPILNCRYHYIGYANNMKGEEVVAYEDSDDAYRAILFADISVEMFPAEQAAKIIAARHK